ncbi:MAG: SGNH/GDSL hydrolase family protein [Flavobacterium sp.]|nr:SGNH/GDSL hydrolase family protein [Flavobacterium sp.]
MKLLANLTLGFFTLLINLGCSQETNAPVNIIESPRQINYLALGDSYTIGQSVCTTCRFPEQLKASLQTAYPNNSFLLQVIAKTGWTTTNLLSEINLVNPSNNFDLVTLLIGVNNQYQNKPFSIYETEFPLLVTKAIACARGDKSNVIVVSIPDYAYTPFGQGAVNISTGIDQYNAFAQNYCTENGIVFINITDITRLGLAQPELVASDGLHPSELAYSKFVERILPKALEALRD